MNYGGHFDPEKRKENIKRLENEISSPNFWDDKKHSEKVISELNSEKKVLEEVQNLLDETKDYLDMVKVTETIDENSIKWLENESKNLNKKIEEEETLILLNSEYDKNDAVLEIHSGAGGTEACDWADMLYRMYSRYAEKKN